MNSKRTSLIKAGYRHAVGTGLFLLACCGLAGCVTTGGGADYAPTDHIDICAQNLDDNSGDAKEGAQGLVWYWQNDRFEYKHIETVLRAFDNMDLDPKVKRILAPILDDSRVPISEIDQILDEGVDENLAREVVKLRLGRIKTYGEAKAFAMERLDARLPEVRYASVYLIREYLIEQPGYERILVDTLVARLLGTENGNREASASVAELIVRTLGEAATSGPNKHSEMHLATIYPALDSVGADLGMEYETDRMPQRPSMNGEDVRSTSNLFSTRLFPHVKR